jgi:hypothetical protein
VLQSTHHSPSQSSLHETRRRGNFMGTLINKYMLYSCEEAKEVAFELFKIGCKASGKPSPAESVRASRCFHPQRISCSVSSLQEVGDLIQACPIRGYMRFQPGQWGEQSLHLGQHRKGKVLHPKRVSLVLPACWLWEGGETP